MFGFSIGHPSMDAETKRAIRLEGSQTEDVEEVTSTFAYFGVRRNETIRFSAHHVSGGTVRVVNASITVVCLRPIL